MQQPKPPKLTKQQLRKVNKRDLIAMLFDHNVTINQHALVINRLAAILRGMNPEAFVDPPTPEIVAPVADQQLPQEPAV